MVSLVETKNPKIVDTEGVLVMLSGSTSNRPRIREPEIELVMVAETALP
jgi:hypothetical protein